MEKPKTLPAKALPLLRAAAAQEEPVYLVGGALRDCWLGRPVTDLDIATRGAKKTAARLCERLGATLVALDAENGVYRAALSEPAGPVRYIDVAELQGDLNQDLLRRDFNLNAMALPVDARLPAALSADALIDPRGGLADIAKKTVRAASESAFRDDPLRQLRAFRVAAQLDFTIDAKTLQMIERNRNRIRQSAGERVQNELLLLLAEPGSARMLEAMDACALLTALFEDLEPARRCATVYYGEGGVLRHSLDTVKRADFLLHNLAAAFPDVADSVEAYLAERSASAPHRAVLKLAALLHDVAKPTTAKQIGGRLRFFGHDALGAKMTAKIMRGLRFSREHIDAVSVAITHHLRPGNLAAGGAVTDRSVYRFFRDIGSSAVGLLLVCWADHASYLPEKRLTSVLGHARRDPDDSDLSRLRPIEIQKTVHHLQVVHHLLARHFQEPAKIHPPKLVDGHDVMKARKLPAGPEVGRVLDQVREAQAAGQIRTRQEALLFLARRGK